MEVSGLLHARAALARGKVLPVRIGERGWIGLRAGLLGIEPRPSSRRYTD
jgi:hypothetical protein